MAGEECKGCIYDLTDKVVTDEKIFNTILDNCTSCKRSMIEECQDKFPDLYKDRDNQMRYTEALRKLFEVMEGRTDILEVKFNRENDSFDVISTNGIHECFGNEFR